MNQSMQQPIISPDNLPEFLGNIDIYFLDQILKGRLSSQMKFLDAGCGGGRNLIYLLRSGYNVFGVDQSEEAIQKVQGLASQLKPEHPKENFQVSNIESMPFKDSFFDFILCNAVLHFAKDEAHFIEMFQELWRILKPNGIFFARLTSSIGIETLVKKIQERTHLLPDGSERFLVDESYLLSLNEQFNGELIEPIKTVNVQNRRCMTNWCLIKR